MARSLPSTIVAAMMAPQSDVTMLALLTFEHPAITTARIVNNTENVTSNSETFYAFPFSVTLPPDGPDATPVAQVVVSNIDRQVVQICRTVAGSAAGLATATLQIVAYDDPDTVLLELDTFRVQNMRYTSEALTFDMTLEFFEQEPFPAMTFTPGRFPGMF